VTLSNANTDSHVNSKEAFLRARRLMPGGVNSPVRAAVAVGRDPLFIARGQGSHIWDIDDNCFIDYVGSWGPLIVGHAHPQVVAAVQAAAERGLGYGAPTELESDLAEELLAAYPSMEQVRLVNSGTEATMSALRLARGATGRDLIVKFEGCYHGHSDALLVKAGSGALTTGTPTSAGVSQGVAATTLVAQYNDNNSIANLFERYGKQIAAVIVEPVAGNMGVVLPQKGFLQQLRSLTSAYGSLLLFDEVMTGFRVAYGGAQTLYGIDPDITCLGKIIGGGLPLAAYGGKAWLMEQVSPQGQVYQAGTLSGNHLAVTAGLATIRLLKGGGIYEALEAQVRRLVEGIAARASAHHISLATASKGALFSLFFTREEQEEVSDFEGATAASTKRYAQFYGALLDAGIYVPPSKYEAWFFSTAHSNEDIEATLQAAEQAFASF
jgi:glutamate-1-semialdehyde 2,1-aminomutase